MYLLLMLPLQRLNPYEQRLVGSLVNENSVFLIFIKFIVLVTRLNFYRDAND